MTASAIYLEQKLAQRCTYHRCTREPADGAQLCRRHLKKQRKRDAQYKKRVREANRAKGLCAFCPTPSKTYRCPACLVAAGFAPKRNSVRSSVDKGARIAARTAKHVDGRTRYHGQGKRGSQPLAQLNEQDLGFAREALAAGEAGLRLLETSEVKELPRIQREDVQLAALHHLELAQGHIADVIGRRRGHAMDRHSRIEAPASAPAAAGPREWDLKRGAVRTVIAEASAGDLIYAPPPPAGDDGKRRAAPDLTELRAGLALRELAITDEGAFFWRVTALGEVARRSSTVLQGDAT